MTIADWHRIEDSPAPRCITGGQGDKGIRPLLVTRSPFNGQNAPVEKAWLTTSGWKTGKYRKLRWEPTHWAHLPEPPS